ncbi:MAG: DUF4139 domain-containing protein, partial [Oscillochloris sp.]|nr:DUF4139 domain-containing protein [Oscillochloris sp.]
SPQEGIAPALSPATCILQGWGIFDNQLDEDLEGVELTLVAGMPISFRYRLYEPRTPERPIIEDEERTVSGPIFFAGAVPEAPQSYSLESLDAMPAMPAPASAHGMTTRMANRQRISASKMEETVEINTMGDERGALFAYQVGHPVSVARGQSAMVPIVSKRLPAHRDLLYNQAKLPAHPVASLRLMNETGLTLERGPVTVLDNGDYAGEAVLPFTRSGGELIVPYAVELGITVSEQSQNERRLYSVNIHNEYMLYEEYDIRILTYHLVSSLDQPAEVMIEHARIDTYSLADTRTPDEESTGFARWRVACPAHSRNKFSVTERHLFSRQERVRSLNADRLRELLRAGLLDAEAVKFLEGVLELYRYIDEAQNFLRQIDKEREAIYKQQHQIQGNLQPLGREGDEGALRQRYVTTLGQLEDALAAAATTEEGLRQRIAQLEEQVRNLLNK